MFALLIPLLAQLPGLIGKYFQQVNDIKSAELEAKRQIEVAKQNMAAEIAKAQMDLNKTIVSSTSSHFKYFTFLMWFGPFMVGVVAPEYSKAIFDNMSTMPQFYVESCLAIMFTVWGISVSSGAINNIFSGLGNFFQSRREYKLELKKIDRKAYYEALRKSKGFVSDADVKEMEPVFDQLDKETDQNG